MRKTESKLNTSLYYYGVTRSIGRTKVEEERSGAGLGRSTEVAVMLRRKGRRENFLAGQTSKK